MSSRDWCRRWSQSNCDSIRSLLTSVFRILRYSVLLQTQLFFKVCFRGISHFGDYGLSRQTISYHLGPGIRFGMYQVGSDKVYWFVAFNENEVASIVVSCDNNMLSRMLSFLMKTTLFRKQRNYPWSSAPLSRNVSTK